MHRVVHPNDTRPDKTPVLLQHGLVDSSNAWLMNSIGGHLDDHDDRNLAFALAKRGFDVWLGNFRGNTYSKNHTNFSSNGEHLFSIPLTGSLTFWSLFLTSSEDPQFWKFTYDNHALQDLPAQIGYIQNQTNYGNHLIWAFALLCFILLPISLLFVSHTISISHSLPHLIPLISLSTLPEPDQIAYVGFSQGSLAMFELLGLRPETSKAIRPYIALAPIAFLGNMTSPLRYFGGLPASCQRFPWKISILFRSSWTILNGVSHFPASVASSTQLMQLLLYRNSEILSNSPFSRHFLNVACRAFPDLICLNSLYMFAGFSDNQMNRLVIQKLVTSIYKKLKNKPFKLNPLFTAPVSPSTQIMSRPALRFQTTVTLNCSPVYS